MQSHEKEGLSTGGINRSLRYSKPRLCAIAAVLAASAGIASAQDAATRVERADDRVNTVDQSVEAYVSDEVLQLTYIRDLQISGFGPVEARGSVFYNEQRDLIGSVDLLAGLGDQARDQRRINVSVGTRMYSAFLNAENEDTFSIAVGGEAQYFFTRDQRMSLKLSAFYGPDILTYGIADRIEDLGLRFQMRVRDGTDIFAGYRALEIDTRIGDREVDDGAQIGFRRSF